MKPVFLLILALLFTGCLSQQTVQTLIDQKIAANNSEYIQPALAQQSAYTAALAVSVDKNSKAISESSALVGVHQDVLLGLFRKQQETAASALDKLTPKKPHAAQPLPAPALSPVAAPAPESEPQPAPAPVMEAVTPD